LDNLCSENTSEPIRKEEYVELTNVHVSVSLNVNKNMCNYTPSINKSLHTTENHMAKQSHVPLLSTIKDNNSTETISHMTLKSTNENEPLKANNIHVTDNPSSDHVIIKNEMHITEKGKHQRLLLKKDFQSKWKKVLCPFLGTLLAFICLVFTVMGIVMESLPIAGSSIIIATVICFSTAFRIIKSQNGKWKNISV